MLPKICQESGFLGHTEVFFLAETNFEVTILCMVDKDGLDKVSVRGIDLKVQRPDLPTWQLGSQHRSRSATTVLKEISVHGNGGDHDLLLISPTSSESKGAFSFARFCCIQLRTSSSGCWMPAHLLSKLYENNCCLHTFLSVIRTIK